MHNVRRVRGVLIDGEVVEFGGDALDSAGYDLLALINGSEGLLAVITEITVKLTPKPQLAQVALAAFDDVEKAGAAVGAIIAAGIMPAGLEMMDQAATRAVEQFVHAELPARRRGGAARRIGRHAEEVAAEMADIRRVLEASRAPPRSACRRTRRSGCSSGPGARRRFPPSGRLSPDYYCIDGTIPRKALPRVLRAIAALVDGVRAARAPTCSTPATATCIR